MRTQILVLIGATWLAGCASSGGETTEARFRKLYLGMLAKRLAQRFHPYDASEMFALDGVIASQ